MAQVQGSVLRGSTTAGADATESFSNETPTSAPSKAELRFACWFCKRYGSYGATGDSCEAKGWPTVHRAKEHCYRRHGPPIACPRCHDIVESMEQLLEHLKSPTSCNLKQGPSRVQHNRLTPSQLGELKRKRRTSEADEWNRIYKSLFSDQTVIPSPYVGDDEGEAGVSPSFQRHVRAQLTVELLDLLEDGIAQGLATPSFLKERIDEAVFRVTDGYKKRRPTQAERDDALTLAKPSTAGADTHVNSVDLDPHCLSPNLKVRPVVDPLSDGVAPSAGTHEDRLTVLEEASPRLPNPTSAPSFLDLASDLSAAALQAEDHDFLWSFDTVLLIDDVEDWGSRSRRATVSALGSIAPIALLEDPEGVDLYFSNSCPTKFDDMPKTSILHEELVSAFKPRDGLFAKPHRNDPIKKRLEQLVDSFLKKTRRTENRGSKTLSVIIVPDATSMEDIQTMIDEAERRVQQQNVSNSLLGLCILRPPVAQIEEGSHEPYEEVIYQEPRMASVSPRPHLDSLDFDFSRFSDEFDILETLSEGTSEQPRGG